MAECTLKTHKKPVITTIYIEEEVYTLTLNKEEATLLLHITESIGGSPINSPRGTVDKIQRALTEAGVGPCTYKVLANHSSIYFENTK